MASIWDGEDTLAGVIWILTSVGAVNWGLLEFMKIDIVGQLATAAGEPFVGTLVYALVGVAGLVTLLDHLGVYDVTDVVENLTGDS
jgi:uncharacterized membrane protein YuzA (DUF378 family)